MSPRFSGEDGEEASASGHQLPSGEDLAGDEPVANDDAALPDPPTPPAAPTPPAVPPPGTTPDNAAAWDEISEQYQATYNITTDHPHYGPMCPGEDELRLCADVRGKRVLDLGCGGGQSSIALARAGAHVIGVDVSDEQIAYARSLAEREEIKVEFKEGDLADLAFVQAASIDLVFSSYAFQYVERFDRLCRSVERVLAHHGLFVFSHDHPMWDSVDKVTGTVNRSYFDSTPMDWHWNGDPAQPKMRSWHRTVSEIVTSVTRAGLAVEAILEPEPVADPTSPWARSYPLELMKQVPATLIVRARKLG